VVLHRGQRDDRLERRSGRIEAGGRTVEAGRVALGGDLRVEQQAELLGIGAADEDRRLVRRARGERADRAVAWVDSDDRAAVGVEGVVVPRDLDAVSRIALPGFASSRGSGGPSGRPSESTRIWAEPDVPRR
jgi:hypothetical protein